jgi:hypothetical protein
MYRLPRTTDDPMERALDAALELTFPASDPTAVSLGDPTACPVFRGDSKPGAGAPFQEAR